MSSAVPIGTFFLVACFIMQCVGVATEYWITASLSGLANSYAGLFKMCYEVLSQQQCVYYIKFSTHFQNVHYFGIVGCSLVGTVLLFITCLIGFCGCSNPNPKPTVQNMSGVGLFGGLFSGCGALWFYLYFIRGTFEDVSTILSTFGVDLGLGYSFYLCCAAGGAAFIISLLLMMIACNMPSNNGSVMPTQPTTVIAVNGSQMPAHQHYPPATSIAMQNASYNDPFAPPPKQGY